MLCFLVLIHFNVRILVSIIITHNFMIFYLIYCLFHFYSSSFVRSCVSSYFYGFFIKVSIFISDLNLINHTNLNIFYLFLIISMC